MRKELMEKIVGGRHYGKQRKISLHNTAGSGTFRAKPVLCLSTRQRRCDSKYQAGTQTSYLKGKIS